MRMNRLILARKTLIRAAQLVTTKYGVPAVMPVGKVPVVENVMPAPSGNLLLGQVITAGDPIEIVTVAGSVRVSFQPL